MASLLLLLLVCSGMVAAQDVDRSQDLGRAAASQRLTLTLTFAQAPERAAALETFLNDVVTAGSPEYRSWLTPEEYAARFGATAEQLDEAKLWAALQGLTVEEVSRGGMWVRVSGFAGQVEAAFGVELHQFGTGSDSHVMATGSPAMKADAAGMFSSVRGLRQQGAGESRSRRWEKKSTGTSRQ